MAAPLAARSPSRSRPLAHRNSHSHMLCSLSRLAGVLTGKGREGGEGNSAEGYNGAQWRHHTQLNLSPQLVWYARNRGKEEGNPILFSFPLFATRVL